MPEEPIIEIIRRNLTRLMELRGIKPTPLSLKIGTSKSLVRDILQNADDVRAGTLQKLARELDVKVAELVSEPELPLVGAVEFGGFTSDDSTLGMVPNPIERLSNLAAAIVRGHSLFPRFDDGELIFFQQIEARPENHLGEHCLIKTVDGKLHVRQLLSGSQPLRYTLRSYAMTDLNNAEVFWVKPIVFTIPAAVTSYLLGTN